MPCFVLIIRRNIFSVFTGSDITILSETEQSLLIGELGHDSHSDTDSDIASGRDFSRNFLKGGKIPSDS